MTKKYIKRTCKVLAAFLAFGLIVKALNYMYLDDYSEPWIRILWDNYYSDEENIDTLLLGTSHVFCGVDPEELEAVSGEHVFNLATSEQKLNGSYYLLREACGDNDVKKVYLEVAYQTMYTLSEDGSDPIDSNYTFNWQNTDNMHWSLNKLSYMLSMTDVETYPSVFFPFTRYRSQLTNESYVDTVVSNKRTDEYKNDVYTQNYSDATGDHTIEIKGQGFYYSDATMQDTFRKMEKTSSLLTSNMGTKSEEYLRKIIEYCEKQDIELTLISIPVDDLVSISSDDYDAFHEDVEAIASEYGVDFYDFNLAKSSALDIWQDQYFANTGHLNAAGAKIFADYLYHVTSDGEGAHTDDFYSSYAERLSDQEPRIYGVDYVTSQTAEEDGTISTVYDFRVISNRDSGLEYRIEYVPYDGTDYGDTIEISDFSEEREFAISDVTGSVLRVIVREAGTDEELQRMTIQL